MSEILQHAFSLPTAVFTVLLGLVVVYWVAALTGFFSFEIFDGLENLFSLGDAADGVANAVDGIDAVTDGSGHGGFFEMIGFHHVPRSISWSLTTFFSWAISLATSIYVPAYDALVTRGMLVVVVLGAGCLVVAIGVTAIAIQPLRRVLAVESGQRRADLVGRVCIIRTGTVDTQFGQAELPDGSAVLQVRTRDGNAGPFQHGARALIEAYDAAREVFYVTALEETPEPDDAT